MILGYYLYGADNNSYMLDGLNFNKCPKCKNKFINEINPDFNLKIKDFDFSFTYDGFIIVSNRFKKFCDSNNYKNLRFTTLTLEKGFYVFEPLQVLKFDANKRGTRFINFCCSCNRYNEIIGATPVFLEKQSLPLEDSFYRTDLIFGSGNEKAPIIILGRETHKKLKSKNLIGLDFDAIEG